MAITSPDNEAVSIFMLGDQCSKEAINLGLSQKNKKRIANTLWKTQHNNVNYKSRVHIFTHNKTLMDSREHLVYFSLSWMRTSN